MCEKGQGLGKERKRSLQDIRDVVGFAENTQSTVVVGERTGPTRAAGDEGGNPGRAKPPKRVRQGPRLR